jgi:EAL domain-containing protein (putative c-di-GMP-specific phosphodiesterase class I)
VHGSHADYYRQAVLESVLEMSRRLGGRVVAEAVEDARDLETVKRVGIDLAQGHLLCPASPGPNLMSLLQEQPSPDAA